MSENPYTSADVAGDDRAEPLITPLAVCGVCGFVAAAWTATVSGWTALYAANDWGAFVTGIGFGVAIMVLYVPATWVIFVLIEAWSEWRLRRWMR